MKAKYDPGWWAPSYEYMAQLDLQNVVLACVVRAQRGRTLGFRPPKVKAKRKRKGRR